LPERTVKAFRTGQGSLKDRIVGEAGDILKLNESRPPEFIKPNMLPLERCPRTREVCANGTMNE
jgi:hypothetical protein